MALLYLESFDGIDTATAGSSHSNFESWASRRCENYVFAGGSGPELFTAYAWGGNGHCMMFGDDGNADSNYIELHAMSGNDTYITGIAIKPGIYVGDNNGTQKLDEIMEWRNITEDVTHITVDMVDGLHLRFNRGTSSYITHVNNALRTGVWQFLEIKITMHETAGAIEVRVNGNEILNETGLNTKDDDGTATEFETIKLMGVDGTADDAGNTYFDDWYICDDTGSNNNDFLGPLKVETLLPTADSTSNWSAYDGTNFDPPTAITRWEMMDNVPQVDDDSSVIYSSTASQQETFVIEDLSFINGDIFGVKMDYDGRNLGSSDTFKALLDSGGSTTTSSALTIPTTTYADAPFACFDVDPQGGGDFTVSRINALLTGVEK